MNEVTQAKASTMLEVQSSSLVKLERGERDVSIRMLSSWCTAFQVPPLVARKMLILFAEYEYRPQPHAQLAMLAAVDLGDPDELKAPAWHIDPYDGTILSVNTIAAALLPWLAPDPSGEPATMLERLFLDARAEQSLANWAEVASAAVTAFEITASGLVPQDRIDQIFDRCRVNPRFESLRERSTGVELVIDPDYITVVPAGEANARWKQQSGPLFPPREHALITLTEVSEPSTA